MTVEQTPPTKGKTGSHLNRINVIQYLSIALVLIVVASVRIRLFTLPLERDEGEFAYMGQLLLKGIPPFTDAYTMKLPGVSIAYAFFMLLFGQTPTGIHAGLLIINAACICAVYLLAKRLCNHTTALFSSASYAVMSLSFSVAGSFAHATHFVVLFALFGFLLLLEAAEKWHFSYLCASGLCFGVAFTMKQHAAPFLLFALLYLAWRAVTSSNRDSGAKIRGVLLFLTAMLTPYLLILFWMFTCSNFSTFWFWTVQYARAYSSPPSSIEGSAHFMATFENIVSLQLPFWLLAGYGFLQLVTQKKCTTHTPFLCGFLVFSFMAICPAFVFRNHYFILLLPAISLLIGSAIGSLSPPLPSGSGEKYIFSIPLVLFLAASAHTLYMEKEHFFVQSPQEVCRAVTGSNPFPEAPHIARYLKEHTTANDHIAVLGSEPEILFYGDRRSATGYIYMYGLMEEQPFAKQMQREMMREIEQTRPKYLVYTHVSLSWLEQPASQKTILDWSKSYLQNYYERVGVIDMKEGTKTVYLWDADSIDYVPTSAFYLTIFKRREGV